EDWYRQPCALRLRAVLMADLGNLVDVKACGRRGAADRFLSQSLPDSHWRSVIWRPAIVLLGDSPHLAQQRRIPFTRPVTITSVEEVGRHVEREATAGPQHGAHGHRGGREVRLPDSGIADDGVDWLGHMLIDALSVRLNPGG